MGFVAFESKCTHLGCQVYFIAGKTPIGERPDGIIYCPCHQGAFDPYRGAKVVYGPPPQPLPRIPLRVVNGRLEAA
jgi:rieske iron-sulfur protein